MAILISLMVADNATRFPLANPPREASADLKAAASPAGSPPPAQHPAR